MQMVFSPRLLRELCSLRKKVQALARYCCTAQAKVLGKISSRLGGETKKMKFRLAILIFFTSLCVACDSSRLTFNNDAELKASDAYERWIPLGVVVLGATEIEASKHSGLVRIRYKYDGERPLGIGGMRPLKAEYAAKAVGYYPKIKELVPTMSIQFRCNRHTVAPEDDAKAIMAFFDVEFVGDTGKDVYYWNSELEEAYSDFCT